MTSRRRFHIQTFGCRVNRVESDTIAAALLEHGWQAVPLDNAELVIINTCTVTGEADAKNRKAIRRACRACAAAVVVTGCAVAVAADDYRSLNKRVVCVPERSEVPTVARRLMEAHGAAEDANADAIDSTATFHSAEQNLPSACAPAPHAPTPAPAAPPSTRYGAGFRTRAGIKVQDGCDNACTFCIVHTARGPARSVPCEQVVAEAKALVEAGAEELVLVGIDLGAWHEGEHGLDHLVRNILDRTKAGRVRLSSIEPNTLDTALCSQLATLEGRLCRHLHVPLQSGSNKVLREMARRYSAEDYLATVRTLRAPVPTLALSTDVMVGFPGETEDDFQQTCSLVRACGFMRLHVFSYSPRPNTPAAERRDQVPPKVKARRAHELTALGHELALADLHRRVGTCEQVVAERTGRGTSESFHEVRFTAPLQPGQLAMLRFTDVDEEKRALVGEPA